MPRRVFADLNEFKLDVSRQEGHLGTTRIRDPMASDRSSSTRGPLPGMISVTAMVFCLTVAIPWRDAIAWEPSEAPAPPPISNDEPFLPEFSARRAADYLDQAAMDWQREHDCVACHTMMPHLASRAALAQISEPPAQIRKLFEDVAEQRHRGWPDGYHFPPDAESALVVGTAWALAMNDHQTGKETHPSTRHAVDRMWSLQRDDGTWEWPFRDVPPIKMNEHYGVTLALVTVGLLADSEPTDAARRGLEKARAYLASHPAQSLHERAMLLWAGQEIEGLVSNDEASHTLDEFWHAQRADGGWALASLVDNTHGSQQSAEIAANAQAQEGYGSQFQSFIGRDQTIHQTPLASDGYATGFVIYVARQAGVEGRDPRIQAGVQWLKTHQRQSGRWFTPSQGPHSMNLIANAGTAYAILALHACQEPGTEPSNTSRDP